LLLTARFAPLSPALRQRPQVVRGVGPIGQFIATVQSIRFSGAAAMAGTGGGRAAGRPLLPPLHAQLPSLSPSHAALGKPFPLPSPKPL